MCLTLVKKGSQTLRFPYHLRGLGVSECVCSLQEASAPIQDALRMYRFYTYVVFYMLGASIKTDSTFVLCYMLRAGVMVAEFWPWVAIQNVYCFFSIFFICIVFEGYELVSV